MPYIDNNGYKLFYEIQGQGDLSLIFIHGLCGDHGVWSKNVPAFTNNYRVVTIDMFGHGDSSTDISPKGAFEALPTAVEGLITKEKLQNVVVIGHSIAGNILLSCIEQNIKNVRGYVFVDCAFNASERVVNSRNKLADTLASNPTDKLNSAIVNWYKTMMDMNAASQDNELILSALENLDGNWIIDFLKATNFVRQAPKTNLPVLIFESDWLTKDQPERSFHKVLAHADYSHWPVSNHFFFVYEAPKFNQRLQDFLDKYFQTD
ncbi:alpha/beta hydrolase [Candidatus Berkelbacteria bacterium]|nr:alpha/beta hydrolase [Candidatus Berkelbacteria bacterium]